MEKFFKVVGGACMSFAAWFAVILGGWDTLLEIFFSLMALDIITGLVVSFRKRSDHSVTGGFLSRAFFDGVSRKLLMILLIILGTALDGLLGTKIVRITVIGFYSANEALSIIENAALAGVPFPKGLLQALERYRAQQDGEVAQKEPE